jgi:Flp pilus assembly protein TadG
MLNQSDAKKDSRVIRNQPAANSRRSRISRGQSAVEFALISILALTVMLVGVQFALIGQAALAVSQGASALARYAAVNPGSVGDATGNGAVTLNAAAKQLLSSSIGTNSWGDLTINVDSYQGTTTTKTTGAPVATVDRLVINLSYNAASKIFLPSSTLMGISFPTTLTASESQLYE